MGDMTPQNRGKKGPKQDKENTLVSDLTESICNLNYVP